MATNRRNLITETLGLVFAGARSDVIALRHTTMEPREHIFGGDRSENQCACNFSRTSASISSSDCAIRGVNTVARASSGHDIATQYLVLATMMFNALVAADSAPRRAAVQAVVAPVASKHGL